MIKIIAKLFYSLVVVAVMVTGALVAKATDPVTDLQAQIDELIELRELSEQATAPLQEELDNLNSTISSIRAQLFEADRQTVELEDSIEDRESDLAEQYALLSARVRSYYKLSRSASPFLLLLASNSASDLTRQLSYRSAIADEDKSIIISTTQDLISLESDKDELEERKVTLALLRASFEKEAAFFEGEIKGAEAYQNQLQGQIAALSARQQEILAARSGSFTVSGDSELADDYLASIQGFNESAPGGYFAVFSFGAYSHRNGMSQYGALGRSQSGQNADAILVAYYPGTTIKNDYPAMDQITVDGKSGSFEDWYLHRIYEVPESWPKEVLKAQAIAARTYAIKYTNNGQGSICSTQSCQVFKDSPKVGAWKEAVEETRGKVLVDGGGNPVSTQYASTHGGWTKTSGWDTTDGSGGSDLLNKAYDAIGGSPWLYKAWWREGYSSGGSTCGRSNPWLSPQEMADIVNAAIALKTGGIDTSRITPITTDCWGGNPYSMDELRNLVAGNGGISNATSVSVGLGDGRTNSVNINGVNMNGDDFCKAFNLRAPGYVRIPQWSGNPCGGAFFNIEHK